ncbi:MAG TPA: sigma 54-interacting transcriptional regulator [Myxococcales bacterium]|nr:sigma 54-interacting transcriptional regulator [Myxococcales bacterium]
MGTDRTITQTRKPRRDAATGQPHLFVVFRCDRPLEGGARISLSGADAVAIGRAQRLELERLREDGATTLRIGVPDPRMSMQHARLQRVLGAWVVADAGSKNGTFCDGRRVERQQAPDGALLELGHTFFLFREAVAASPGDVLEPPSAGATPRGFATLVPAFEAELARIERIARSTVPVLLSGETGTGKEVIARAIHKLSDRPGQFQAVNCAAIAPNLVESELFGHKKGAFTSAVDEHPGAVRSSNHGTLLLDEIGDLPLPAQAALLRVLQENEVLPVGSSKAIPVDLRVLAATNRDLDQLAADQRFRPDLLARLAGYRCTLPALRERREDFALLSAAVLEAVGAPALTFSVEAARALLGYGWPLNVRELEKCLAAAAVLADGGQVELEHLPLTVRAPAPAPAPATPPQEGPDAERRDEIVKLLREHGGNVTAVARAMGKARTQVQRWLRRFRIDPLSFRR